MPINDAQTVGVTIFYLFMTKHKPLPLQKQLKESLDYNAVSGQFTWKCDKSNCKSGDIAGNVTSKGYIRIKINSVSYKAHRLAWLYETDEDPGIFEIDHINGDRLDNSFLNLRKTTSKQNNQNRKAKGICFRKKENKWQAQIRVDGKLKHLGLFKCPLLARLAYEDASVLYFNEFSRYNNNNNW